MRGKQNKAAPVAQQGLGARIHAAGHALSAPQLAEIAKYRGAYSDPNYHMSGPRYEACAAALKEQPWRGSYLDVSCGRGEMLALADRLGFERVYGTEAIDDLVGGRVRKAVAWSLPWGADRVFDIVSMFDVIEHLLPGDDERACRELARVARYVILLTANNLPSVHKGVDLHVNRRPYEQWDQLFRQWFPGQVTWLKGRQARNSEMWRIDLSRAAA